MAHYTTLSRFIPLPVNERTFLRFPARLISLSFDELDSDVSGRETRNWKMNKRSKNRKAASLDTLRPPPFLFSFVRKRNRDGKGEVEKEKDTEMEEKSKKRIFSVPQTTRCRALVVRIIGTEFERMRDTCINFTERLVKLVPLRF